MTDLDASLAAHPADPSRRRFLRLAALAGVGLAAWPRAALAGRGGGAGGRTPIPFGTAEGVASPYLWRVKASSAKVGPGPNLFSDLEGDVYKDGAGLHLTITKKGSRWYCTEVIGERSLGYGTYRWVIASDVANLDLSVVLGLFTWDDAPEEAHREVDIEFAKWANASTGMNAQYTVQPWDTPGHRALWPHSNPGVTTHEFRWQPGRVDFVSRNASGGLLHSWSYAGSGVPTPGAERPRMNLWLFRGRAPESGRNLDITLQDFTFVP